MKLTKGLLIAALLLIAACGVTYVFCAYPITDQYGNVVKCRFCSEPAFHKVSRSEGIYICCQHHADHLDAAIAADKEAKHRKELAQISAWTTVWGKPALPEKPENPNVWWRNIK